LARCSEPTARSSATAAPPSSMYGNCTTRSPIGNNSDSSARYSLMSSGSSAPLDQPLQMIVDGSSLAVMAIWVASRAHGGIQRPWMSSPSTDETERRSARRAADLLQSRRHQHVARSRL
jgi:hypothetical protein